MFYKKKRKKGRVVILLCIMLLFAGFTYGYITNNKPLNKPQDNNKSYVDNNVEKNYAIEDKNNNKENIAEVNKESEDEINDNTEEVNQDSEIVFNTYYLKTGKIDTKRIKVPITVAGGSSDGLKEYIEKNYSDWIIKSITVKTASLYKEVDGYNPNFFIIQNKDGYITVYKINEVGEKELYEVTDISISTLSETDKKKLNEGIIAESLEELYRIMEDYSS